MKLMSKNLFFKISIVICSLSVVSLASTFEWEGTRCGVISDKVPEPWENITVDAIDVNHFKIGILGRTLIFNGSILPTQINTGDRDILATPVFLEKDGLKGKPCGVKLVEQTARYVILKGNVSYPDFRAEISCRIEFDGLCKISIYPILGDKKQYAKSFRLQIPLKADDAYLAKVGGFAGRLSHEVVSQAWAFPLWVGWETGGLTMFTESNRWWVNPNPKQAFCVTPRNKTTLIEANFITAYTSLKKESCFEVFIQPTPMKPFPKERSELGNFHGAFPDVDILPAAVNCEYPAKSNISLAEGTLDMVFAAGFDPKTELEPLLGKEPYVRELFTLNVLGRDLIRVAWSLAHQGIIVDEGIQPHKDVIWDVTRETLIKTQFKGVKDTAYRLTLTWGAESIKLYINGVLAGQAKANGLIRDIPSEKIEGPLNIRLGEGAYNFLSPRFGKGIKVSGIRILNHQKLPEKDENPLMLIKGTLLLDTYGSCKKQKNNTILTRPEVGKGGIISTGGTIAKGDNGNQAILYQKSENSITCLERMKQMGVKTLIYHEGWAKIQSHYIPKNPDKLKRLIANCNKTGIKLLLYFGFQISKNAPEWQEWHMRASRLNPDAPLPKLKLIRRTDPCLEVCYAGPWQDFMTFAIQKALDTYKFDGVYIDVAMVPYPCQNYLHGCGWKDANGKVHATQPIYEHIVYARRIYDIVKKAGGIVTVNQAVFPIWAYADSVWVGEGYKYSELGENPLKAIPLAQWRAMFDGRNLGTPGEMLQYEYPPHWRRDTGWAFAGIHYMFLRPENWWRGVYLEKVARIWHAFENFNSADAEFIGYWSKDAVQTGDSYTKVSYWKSAEGVLLWISNFEVKAKEIEVKLPDDVLKLSPKAYDPIYQQEYPVTNNELKIDVGPYNWRMLWIKKQ